jgi:hypothetical protein
MRRRRFTTEERIEQLRRLEASGVVEKDEQQARLGVSRVQLHRIRAAARAAGVAVSRLPSGRRVTASGDVATTVPLRLPPKLARKLRRHCAREKVSMNAVVVEALEAFLEGVK